MEIIKLNRQQAKLLEQEVLDDDYRETREDMEILTKMAEDAQRLVREYGEEDELEEIYHSNLYKWYYYTYKKQRELMKYCRYYGKAVGRKMENKTLAFYEQCWVSFPLKKHIWHVKEYMAYNLELFNITDGVPISLKALLFNRYCHWCGGYGNDAESFKKWYKEFYYYPKTKTTGSSG